MSCSSMPSRHVDVVVEEVMKTLKLAKKNKIPQDVMKSIERTLELVRQKDELIERVTSKDSEGCARLALECNNHNWQKVYKEGKTTCKLVPEMLSGTLEGQFLKSLVSIQKAKKVMEVGMFTGFGSLSIAEALPADGEVVTIDRHDYLRELIQPLFDQYPHGKKVKIRIGDSIEVMRQYANSGLKFDIIFIDADKAVYEEMLKICFRENLLASQGTVLVSNAFQHAKAYDPDAGETVAKSFATYLDGQKDLHKVLIPMRDGIYMVRRMCDVEGRDVSR